jgi:glycosyltransferase involved in cell wall biosynthesis
MTGLKVLRVYHGGRSGSHRARERALAAAGIDVTLIVPASWPEGGDDPFAHEPFRVVELPMRRPGDVNRHAYADATSLGRLVHELRPDVLDVHEEPVSIAARQWLAAAAADLPVVMYTAQNVDKRYPPPFAQYERAAHRRVAALYPCSRQAASVVRGKGFVGLVEVLPLGYDDSLFFPGEQSLDDAELVFGLFGRLVPEKGVTDAVHVLARLHVQRPTRLVVVGNGPEATAAREVAAALGIADRLELVPWRTSAELAAIYRGVHVVLLPSRPTETWVEQFGRVIVEAQASGAIVAGYARGSIPEVAGEAGVLTAAGGATALAGTISKVVHDAGDFERRRRAGIALSATRTWTCVAAGQARLYGRVAAGDVPRVQLPRSPNRRRSAARAEFGPPAATVAGLRPFALPLLRRGGFAAYALGRALDATAELVSRLDGSGGARHGRTSNRR